MTDSHPQSDYAPRDIGTALASCIAIIFISMAAYTAIAEQKMQLAHFKQAHWHEIQLTTTANHLTFSALQFRTGDLSLYIHQFQRQIYQQNCHGFKATCKAIEQKTILMQSATFYSDSELLTPSAHLMLKALEFTDEKNTPQHLTILARPPNHPKAIAEHKTAFGKTFLLTFFIFSLFTVIFYFNHLGRYLATAHIVKTLNLCIVAYYILSCTYFFISYLLM